jgi:uncharacterized membrane protein YdbT with pleckstrin-like domain
MAYPAKLLGADEKIVYETRPHWRVLIVPVIAFFVIVGVTAYVLGQLDGDETWRTVSRWIVFLAGASAFSYWVIRPLIFWWTTLYVFTDRRIITRTGLIARRGRDMPLSRTTNVSFNYTVIERIFNCGTLIVESAGESGQLDILNVPNVEELQRDIYRLHEEDDVRRRRAVADPLQTDPSGGPSAPNPGSTPAPGGPSGARTPPDDGT